MIIQGKLDSKIVKTAKTGMNYVIFEINKLTLSSFDADIIKNFQEGDNVEIETIKKGEYENIKTIKKIEHAPVAQNIPFNSESVLKNIRDELKRIADLMEK